MTNLDYLHDLMYVYRKLANNLTRTREPVDASEIRNQLLKDLRDLRKDLPELFNLQVSDLVNSGRFLIDVELVMNVNDDPIKIKFDENQYNAGYVARLIHEDYKRTDNYEETPLEIRAKEYAQPFTVGKDYGVLVERVSTLIATVSEKAPLPPLKLVMIHLEDVRQAIVRWQSPYKIVDVTLWEIEEGHWGNKYGSCL